MAGRRRSPSREKPAPRAGRKRSAQTAGAKKPSRPTAKAADPHAAVRRYRERMRAKGYRPVTIWAPDVANPEFVRRFEAGVAAVVEHERANVNTDADFWRKVGAEAWTDLPDYDWGPDGPPQG